MQTIRLTPVILLVACSLEIQGTNPRSVSPDAGGDTVTPPSGIRDDAGREQPCTHLDDDGECAAPGTDAAEPMSEQDAGPDTPDACPSPCGCGVTDADQDLDGTPDCVDECPLQATKTTQGVCGCELPDVDLDQDGIIDCVDGCISSNGSGTCGCDADKEDCGDKAPRVTWLEPSSDTVQAATLTVRAAAQDPDGKIRRVTLFVDGKAIREERTEPYVWGVLGSAPFELTSLSAGVHVFMVEAANDKGTTAQAMRELTIVR